MQKQLLAGLLVLSLSAIASAGDRNTFSHSSRNADSDRCEDHVRIHSDEAPAVAYAEETRTLPNSPLKIEAARNGGIHVRNWNESQIKVKLCKVAAAADQNAANAVAQQIAFSESAGALTATGPEQSQNHWTAVFLVFAPKGATLDLTANNGGISLHAVDANVTARTKNGGISLDRTSGQMEVTAVNGGISIKNAGGEVKARVTNGGLSLHLAEQWQGAGLDAATQNGGLSVSIPKNFQSSLEVVGGRHTAVTCKSDICSKGERTWEDDKRIFRIGGAQPVIRASTVNGGVVIREQKPDMY